MKAPDADVLVLDLASPAATLALVGGKGASLARLAAHGLPVPPGFHLSTRAYRRFVDENRLAEAIRAAASGVRADEPATLDRASREIQSLMTAGAIPSDITARVCEAYRALGPEGLAVAVRSSATAEDLPDLSFAGQQDTYLNVRGEDQLLESVKRCWASLWTARAIGYRARQGLQSPDLALAVVVQQLVPAESAGVLFTANPMTGARNEFVINAAWGLGEAIVGGHVTPDLFIVDSRTGAVVSQTLAEKCAMTVRVPGGTREQPVPAEQRSQPALGPEQAAELARLGRSIERLYDRPMDVEWALASGRPFILQARPITTLPDRAKVEWTLPQPTARYFRSSVIELLPDPLSPLFATVALPLWNAAMRNQMSLIAPGSALSERVQTLVTINHYAYYEVPLTAWHMLRLVLAVLRRFRFVLSYCMIRGESRWKDEALPRYAQVVREWEARDPRELPAARLLEGLRAIVHAAADYYLTIQTGILPAAFGSEALFTTFYGRLSKRRGDPPAVTFLLGFDSEPVLAEKALYDLSTWARSRPALAAHLAGTPSPQLVDDYATDRSPLAGEDGWAEFRVRFSEYLRRFGHSVYDLDFAKSLPADDPAPLLETLKHFVAGEGQNPYERQMRSAEAREQAGLALLRRSGLRAMLFRRLLPWAQRFAPLREDALAGLGLGWPLGRRLTREVGRRLASAGSLAAVDDVFMLTVDEAEALAQQLDRGHAPADYRDVTSRRRASLGRMRTVTPPVVLPVKGGARLMGIDFSALTPARSDQESGASIKGQGASAGRVAGVARVIHGPSDFGAMRRGDILVAKATTPAWTPLFALAAGVVTDVGGALSHSSIVAREYRIPAVLGTGVATGRIRSGQRIIVDGDNGVVTIDAAG